MKIAVPAATIRVATKCSFLPTFSSPNSIIGRIATADGSIQETTDAAADQFDGGRGGESEHPDGDDADEHLAVRTRAGLFDVSHMGQIEIAGKDALKAVQHITSNDASIFNSYYRESLPLL